MDLLMKKSKPLKIPKSKIWYQTFDEVVQNPYDYENQKLFIKESKSLLNKIYKLYDSYQLKFHRDDKSIEKCVWMLQIDALDTLRDCIYLVEKKKHRLVGKMFRDIVEILDIAHLIKEKPNKYLTKWYNNKIISHSEYREYLKEKNASEAKEKSKSFYQNLSQWTHHTYFILKNSYSLGENDMFVYDGHYPKILVLPQTISQYLFMLNILIKKIINEMDYSKLFDINQMESFKKSKLFN